MEKTNSKDLHRLKENNEILLESLEFNLDFIQNSNLGFILFNHNKVIQNWNSSALFLFGYENKDLTNLTIFDLFAQLDSKKENEAIIQKYLSSQKIENVEVKVRNPNGEHKWINFNLIPIKNKQNLVIGSYFIGLDITNQKSIEERLLNSEEKYKSIFNSMKNAVAVFDVINEGNDFKIKDINKYAESIEKIKRKDLIGKKVTEIFPGIEDFGLINVFRRVWKTGLPEVHPLTYYKDYKREGWRENYVYKLTSGEIVAIYDDVTEKVNHDRILKRSEENLNQVLNFEKMILLLLKPFLCPY